MKKRQNILQTPQIADAFHSIRESIRKSIRNCCSVDDAEGAHIPQSEGGVEEGKVEKGRH
eukprot:747173-Hanusia_phi.AAC.3